MRKEAGSLKTNTNPTCWRALLSESVVSADRLSDFFPIHVEAVQSVIDKYPMRINPYFLSLIRTDGDAIWKQVVPDAREMDNTLHDDDPLSEDELSPVPGLIHRYPDRVLFLVSDQCAVYCRFCLRKRRVGMRKTRSGDEEIALGLEYLKENRNIREVVLSGGDPLLLEDDRIDILLAQIRSVSHIGVVRIHTRIPCVLPQRITQRLAQILKRHHPLFINTHFNHPDEITPEAVRACTILADAGIPLGCQTVLLKGVNDNPVIMKRLMQKLIRIRVKPYYLHHADPVQGTAHFRTSLETGLHVMQAMRGNISGLCLPDYVIDLPGGKGKVPLLPDYVKERDANRLAVENYEGEICEYSPE